MTRPSVRILAWIAAAALTIAAGLTGERLGRYTEPLRRGALEDLGPAQRALSAVSSEIRRLLADMLWVRIDSYIHESRPIPAAGGGWGVSYLTTLDIVPLYRLITYLDPSFIEVYSMAANHLFFGLGKPAEALQLLREGIQRNRGEPRIKELYGQLGILYLNELNDPARAIPPFRACHDLLVEYGDRAEDRHFVYDLPTITSLLVIAYYRLGQVDLARAYLMEGTSLPPDNPVSLALTRKGALKAPYNQPTARPGDLADDHDHDHENAPGHGSAERRPAEPHLRIWLEPERLAMIYTTSIGAGVGALVLLALRLGRRRSPLDLALALGAGITAGLSRHAVLALLDGRGLDLFLAFTLAVAVVLVGVLRVLLQRGQRQGHVWAERFEEYIDEALERHPADTRFYEVALLWFQSGFHDKALRALGRIGPTAEPFHTRVMFYTALSLLKLGRVSEAQRVVGDLSPAGLGRHDRAELARAFDENGPLARMRDTIMHFFLTDFGTGGEEPRGERTIDRETQIALLDPMEAPLIRALPARYRELTLIGRVEPQMFFSAFDRNLSRPVHLRVLDPRMATRDAVARFLETATTLGRLTDPRFPRVHDIARDGLPYYAMEPINGIPLARLVADRLDASRRVHILEQIVALAGDVAAQDLAGRAVSLSDVLVGAGDVVLTTGLVLPPQGTSSSMACLALARDAHTLLVGRPASGDPTQIEEVARQTGEILAHPPEGDPPAALGAVRRDLVALRRLLDLSASERDRQRSLRLVAWIDDVHRSRVHALKSKFAVCDRYRGEPAKLMRTFCRSGNIEEVAHLLDGLASRVKKIPSREVDAGPTLGPIVAHLTGTDFQALAARVRALAGGGAPGEAGPATIPFLESTLELFRALSVEMGRAVELHEVDLVAALRSAITRSPYFAQIALTTEVCGQRLRAADSAKFAAELGTAVDNLIANAFEAHATHVTVSLIAAAASPVARISIVDDGTGIDPAIATGPPAARITTKEGGTATGLAVARAFVQSCVGSMDIRALASRGTCVELLLPVHREFESERDA